MFCQATSHFFSCIDLQPVNMCYDWHKLECRYTWHHSSKIPVHVKTCTKLQMHRVIKFLAAEGNRLDCNYLQNLWAYLSQDYTNNWVWKFKDAQELRWCSVAIPWTPFQHSWQYCRSKMPNSVNIPSNFNLTVMLDMSVGSGQGLNKVYTWQFHVS
jgi:hypothetical protein